MMRVSRGDARRRGADWAPSAIAAVLVVMIWAQIRSGHIPALDRWVRSLVAEHQHSGLLELAEMAKNVGAWTWVAPLVVGLAAGVAMVRATWRPLILAVASVAGLGAATLVLKAAVGRAGPHGVGPPAVDGSWPSGHALTAVVGTLVLIAILSPTWRPRGLVIGLAALPTAVVGFAVVYGGHHWLTDVLVAIPLGYLIVRAGWLAADVVTNDDARAPTQPALRHGAGIS